MNDFRNDRSNKRGSFRRDSGRRGSGGSREMHDAVCDECGKNCKVPFRPSGDKPIYCSDCFEKKGGKGSSDRGSRGGGRRDFRGGGSQGSDQAVSKLSKRVEDLNKKMDTIISMLSKDDKVVESEEKIVEAVEEETKPKKAKKKAAKKTSKTKEEK